MRVLLLDNYDSFTYNLLHLVEKVSSATVDVWQNDKITLSEIAHYDHIILSPGPGLPAEAGIMPQLIRHFYASKHILGVCLGLQGLAEAFGARLKNLDTVYHGIATPVNVSADDPLFCGCPQRFLVGRYHSWVVDEHALPADLQVTATDDSGLVMALRHAHYPVSGVQFHPESILSEQGEVILANWLAEKL